MDGIDNCTPESRFVWTVMIAVRLEVGSCGQ